VFTIPILAFTMADLGVHDAPIPAFTMDRSARSHSAGTRNVVNLSWRKAPAGD
jgi:hypothetical protein